MSVMMSILVGLSTIILCVCVFVLVSGSFMGLCEWFYGHNKAFHDYVNRFIGESEEK